MSITDELRTSGIYSFPSNTRRYTLEELTAIADRIDAECQKACDDAWDNGYEADYRGIEGWLAEHPQVMEKHSWIRLPVDADGAPIHVGDMMERGKSRGQVIALMLSEYPEKWSVGLHWAVQLEGEQAPTALDAFFHHYHKPTVEDVLDELVIEWDCASDCEDRAALLKEYAAKFRFADEKE